MLTKYCKDFFPILCHTTGQKALQFYIYEEYFQCSPDQDEYDYPSFFYGIYNDNYRKVLDPNWYCDFCDFTDTDFEKVKKHEEICNK